MHRTLPLVLAIAAGLAAPAALAKTNSYTLSGFDKVAATHHVTVVVRQGPFAVEVSEPDGRFGELILEVRDHTLIAGRKPFTTWGWWSPQPPQYTITVTLPAATELSAADHARLTGDFSAPVLKVSATDHSAVSGAISAADLQLSARDHASLDVRSINARTLAVRAGDHSDITLAGACASLDSDAVSHAQIHARDLKCETGRMSAADHAYIGAFAAKAAYSRARGHAGVEVFGNPPSLQSDAADHSSVRRG